MKKILTTIAALFVIHSIPASATEYDVYLLAGQSNMDGRGKTKNLESSQQKASTKTIIFYRNPPHASDGWEKLQPGFSIPPKYKGGLPSPTFGPEIGFAAGMQKAQPKQNFAFIKGSKGGTNLRKDWTPGLKGKPKTQGPCYLNFIETINLATKQLTKDGHTFKISGLIWHQGESDSKTNTKLHHQRLTELLARIREDTGIADLPFVLGEVYDNGSRDKVRAAIQAACESDPLCGLVTSEGTTTWDPGTHFDAKSQLLLGQRYAEAMLKLTSAP
ncbi:MAG: sialate O-acetylesterase [Akkermansiaceae bacterium]